MMLATSRKSNGEEQSNILLPTTVLPAGGIQSHSREGCWYSSVCWISTHLQPLEGFPQVLTHYLVLLSCSDLSANS